ncbi:hypothetical protein [Frigoribacterium sp. CFBP 13707]|uniref:hypothetical protein n=1 Tax=Frigoribacterium sp. CFBP 13707 TaxID=2775313 RepID=UPI00177FB8CF|nr:hypothetical protein [Frigoribacterium sp. CFBP 13707]MBD8729523.1 hypothetical protein [Frigoribacterium sp. CFBP 13707]
MTTPRSTRACTLPAAALAVALVLAPTAAFAADGDTVSGSAPVASGADTATTAAQVPADAATAAPTEAPLDAAPIDSAAGSPDTTAGTEPEASTPSGVVTGGDTPSSAVLGSSASTQEAPTGLVAEDGDEVLAGPEVFSTDGRDLHPGFTTFFGASGFAPGELATINVTGSDGRDLSGWLRIVPNLAFGADGETYFTVTVPVDVDVPDVVTLTVSDQSGRTASVEALVSAFVVSPYLDAPVSATAGVVRIEGHNGEAGQVAVVSVVDRSLVDAPESEQGGEDGVDGAALQADEVAAEDPEIVTDDAPVVYDPIEGVAYTVVPIDENGDFTASFVLPEGDYVSDAAVFRRDGSASSDFSEPIAFSVSAAAVVPAPVAAAAVAAPAAVPVSVAPVRTARAAGLAYTGSDPSPWLAVAAGLLAAGAAALAASRRRGRRA